MPTEFPGDLDSWAAESGSNKLSDSGTTGKGHADIHTDVGDAVEALEAKVGVTESAVATSLEARTRGVKNADMVLSWDGTNARVFDTRRNRYCTKLGGGTTWSDYSDAFNYASSRLTGYGLWDESRHYYCFPGPPTYVSWTADTTGLATDPLTGNYVSNPLGMNPAEPPVYWYYIAWISAASSDEGVERAGGESPLGEPFYYQATERGHLTVHVPPGPAGTTARRLYRTYGVVDTKTDTGDGLGDPRWDVYPYGLSEGTTPQPYQCFLISEISGNNPAGDDVPDTWTDEQLYTNSGPPQYTKCAGNRAPTYKDGGSIFLQESSSLSIDGTHPDYGPIVGSIPINKVMCLHSQQSLKANGRLPLLMATSSAMTQVGTLAATLGSTATGSFTVNESGSTPPNVPFACEIDNEQFWVYKRTGGSNPRTYYFTTHTDLGRGAVYFAEPASHSLGAKVMVPHSTALGLSRGGAMLDVYNSCKNLIEDISLDGADRMMAGMVFRRPSNAVNGDDVPSGISGHSPITNCEVANFTGTQYSIGLGMDQEATSAIYMEGCRAYGNSKGRCMVIAIGDVHISNNCNFHFGWPCIVVATATVLIADSHLKSTHDCTRGVVRHVMGQNLVLRDNYFDDLSPLCPGIYRTSADTGNLEGLTVVGNHFNVNTSSNLMGDGKAKAIDGSRYDGPVIVGNNMSAEGSDDVLVYLRGTAATNYPKHVTIIGNQMSMGTIVSGSQTSGAYAWWNSLGCVLGNTSADATVVDNVMGGTLPLSLRFKQQTGTPTDSPAAGYGILYMRSSDGHLCFKRYGAAEVDLEA